MHCLTSIARDMIMRIYLLLGTILSAAPAWAAAVDFASPGPCKQTQWQTQFSVPASLQAALGASLPIHLTIPQCDTAGAFGNPSPVLWFYNGFVVGDT